MRFALRANISPRSTTRRSARPRPSRRNSSPPPTRRAVDRRAQGPRLLRLRHQYLIDTEHAVIVDVEATRAIRQAEVGAAQTMIERTETRFGMKPVSLTADSAYGSAESLPGSSIRRRSSRSFPSIDKSDPEDGTFSREAFAFDPERDRYTCPAQASWCTIVAISKPRNGVSDDGLQFYRATKRDCDACHLKARCCPGPEARKLPRHIYEEARTGSGSRVVARIRGGLSGFGRRSRCCSPTSSASSGSAACVCGDRTAQETNSCSPPPPKI